MPPSNGVSDELLAARKLAPEITRRADEFERERVVAPEIVSAMVEAGLVEMAIPKAYGGSESHLLDIIDVIEAISYADASTGWCLMNYQTTAFAAALMEPSGARMVFDGAERAVPAGVLAPTGRARRVKDGLVVSGRWAFASGCDNANWMLGNVIVTDEQAQPISNADGSPQMLLPFFSRDQIRILDTWHVAGLCASGSHDVEVSDAFVPEGRWLSLATPSYIDTPLFRFPIVSTFPPCVAAVGLGIARAAFDCFTELATAKVPFGGTTPLRERGSAQIDVSQAEALIAGSMSYIRETVNTLWETVKHGNPASDDERRRVRLAGISAAANAARAVDLLYNAAGATAIAQSCPLQRYFRDVHVVTQHIHVSHAGLQRMGKLLLTGELEGLL